jgi:hypothetical protein
MKPGSHPFRGEPPRSAKSRLKSQQADRKFEAKRRQKRGIGGFALMLNILKSRHQVNIHGGYFFYWINCRDGWNRRHRLHPVKLKNQAAKRLFAAIGIPF